jgi:hypothetical protein
MAKAKSTTTRAAMNGKVRKLLEDFAGDPPHPEATLYGRYSFRPGDRWHGRKIGAYDGWYTNGAWSIRIKGGAPVDAVRGDIEQPKAARL